MVQNRLTSFYIVCVVCFFLTYSLFYSFYLITGLPFGRVDVDRYMCWLGLDLSYRTVCTSMGYDNLLGFDYIHGFFIYSIRFMSGLFRVSPAFFLTFFIPFLLWAVLPLSLVKLGYAVLKDWVRARNYAYFVLLGSSLVFYFGVVSLWAQFIGFILFLWCLTTLVSKSNFWLLFAGLSILFYPHMLVIYGLLILPILSHGVRFKHIILLVTIALGLILFSGINLVKYTRYVSADYAQPDAYTFLSVILNPVLFILFFLGCEDEVFFNSVWFLVIAGFMSDLGRGLIMFIPIIYLYSYIGFEKFLTQTENKETLKTFFYAYIIVFFNYLFSYYFYPTMEQMFCKKEFLCRNMERFSFL